jgi:uncharacterized RDD family membrane protein YckC
MAPEKNKPMNKNDIPKHMGYPFAGFWRRVGARIIDHIVITFSYGLVAGYIWDDLMVEMTVQLSDNGEVLPLHVPSLIGLVVLSVWTWAYIALQECSRVQATLGKRALRIKVCNYNGDRISLFTASYRSWPHWLFILASLTVNFGFIVLLVAVAACVSVAFTKRKQGLHDKMAGCLVVKRRAVFSDPPPST